MHIFISAYVLLALASWSALAAPLSGYERDNKSAQKRSLSSSILMGRQQPTLFGPGPGPGGPPQSTSENANPDLDLGPMLFLGPDPTESTGSQTQSQGSTTGMDCDTKSKSHKDDGNTNDDQPSTATTDPNSNPDPTTTLTATSPGPEPAIAKRRFGSPMRRGDKGSPSIFERDDPPTKGASSNPITIGDVITGYLNQKAATRKRAPSPPRTSRNFY